MGQGNFLVVFVLFNMGWVYRNWGDKGVIVRECAGQVWCSGPRELRVSMGLGVCIAGDHLRHGTEFLFLAACLYCYKWFGPTWDS